MEGELHEPTALGLCPLSTSAQLQGVLSLGLCSYLALKKIKKKPNKHQKIKTNRPQQCEAVQLQGFTFGGQTQSHLRKMLQASASLVAGRCHHIDRCQQGSAAQFRYQRVCTPLSALNHFAADPQVYLSQKW